MRKNGGWIRSGRGWWRIAFETIQEKYLKEICDIPGVTVVVTYLKGTTAHNVTITAHRTALFAPAFETFFEACDCAPDALNDHEPIEFLWAPPESSGLALRSYQEHGIEWLVDGGGGLMCDGMGLGKGLVHGTTVQTPSGPRAVETLNVGDTLCNTYGGVSCVTGVFPQGMQDVYRVSFSDGTHLDTDAAHRWFLQSAKHRLKKSGGKIFTTSDLCAQPLQSKPDKRGWCNSRWFLPEVQPLVYDARAVSVDPYVLGVLLGDGSLTSNTPLLTNPCINLLRDVASRWSGGTTLRSTAQDCPTLSLHGGREKFAALRLCVLSHEKFIPNEYIFNSVENRKELLAGLLDTDSECSKDGTVMFCTSSVQLADDTASVARSLGCVVSRTTREVTKYEYNGETRFGRVSYKLNIRAPFNPYRNRAERKSRWKKPILVRAVKSVDKLACAETTCIAVDAENKLFVAGDYVPTHNTLQTICAAQSLLGGRGHALIVGPKFTRAVWRMQLIMSGAIASEDDYFFADGKRPKPEDEARMAKCRYWFVHYELLDAWKHVITRPLKTTRPDVAIVDEAHWMRNPKSKRGHTTRSVSTLIKHTIALTGTPMLNRIADMWSLLTAVCGEGSWGTFFQFKQRYTNASMGDHGWVSSGTRNEEEFSARLASCYLRRTEKDVNAEIPALTRILHRVDGKGTAIDPELRQFIGKDRSKALVQLREHFRRGSYGTDTLPVLTAWRKWTSRAKLSHTSELAASTYLEREHVVIFAWTRETVERLGELIAKAVKAIDPEAKAPEVLIVHGQIDQKVRDERVAAFQANPLPMILIATLESLKEGVTLHRARRVLIHDVDWTPGTLLQAEKRISRLGQLRACTSTWVVVENSADEIIVEHLLRKAAEVSVALGDETAKEALDELDLSVRETVSDDAQTFLRALINE